MERTLLLDKLTTVAPALANNDFIPILTHLWFSQGRVMAFNDQIAISTPCKFDFDGAVPSTLLDLIKASKAKEVTFEHKNDALLVKAASSRVTLACLPPEDFVFEMPADKSKDALPAGAMKPFLAAVAHCMRSVSSDTTSPDQLGVTLIKTGTQLQCYSTDGATLCSAEVTLDGKPPLSDRRVILSSAFCEQMLSLTRSAKTFTLELHKDYALLIVGDTRLFGRLVESDRPLDFAGVIKYHMPASAKRDMVAIPSKLRLILERACIIAEVKGGRAQTAISVGDGRMSFYTKSDRGEIRDSMQVENRHPDVDVRLEARLLKNGYGDFDKMLITPKCAVMTKGNALYLVSASSV